MIRRQACESSPDQPRRMEAHTFRSNARPEDKRMVRLSSQRLRGPAFWNAADLPRQDGLSWHSERWPGIGWRRSLGRRGTIGYSNCQLLGEYWAKIRIGSGAAFLKRLALLVRLPGNKEGTICPDCLANK